MSQKFHESLRYEYPLTPEHTVIDAGGFEGGFAGILTERYGCRVHVYEPVLEFAAKIVTRFRGTPQEKLVTVINAGLGANDRRETFGIKGDQTGVACTSPNRTEEVQIIDVVAAIERASDADMQVFLCKLNVEGMEFEIMESLLDRGLTHRVTHFQIQPHNHIPRAEERWKWIKNRMMLNHRITWDEPWCWTGFSLK